MNIASFLSEAAIHWPDRPAVITPTRQLTFSEINERAREITATLHNLKLPPGTGLGLVARNGPEFIAGLFGGIAAGLVVMPISHQLKEHEFNQVLERVPVVGVLDDGSLKHTIKGAASHPCGLLTIHVRHERGIPVAPGVPDAAVIRFTSGTTGSSKGVVLSHRAVEERSSAAIEGLGLAAGDRVTWVLPMAYHFVVSILTYVRYGVTVVLPVDSLPASILTSIGTYGSSLLYASPLILQMLAADQSSRSLPESMKIVSTSSSLSPEVRRTFFQRYGVPVSQVYGLIEIGLPLGNIHDSAQVAESTPTESVGTVMPGYEAAIVNEAAEPLPPGTLGRLAVRGPGMFDAYLAPYHPRTDVLENGWFLTGDLAILSKDGRITVCGREKSVINSAGNKIFPEEVEGVITAFPGVAGARVFGMPHPLTGEVVAAEIILHPHLSIDLDRLRSYCYERLSPYKVPKDIKIVPALPMTGSGKIVRAA